MSKHCDVPSMSNFNIKGAARYEISPSPSASKTAPSKMYDYFGKRFNGHKRYFIIRRGNDVGIYPNFFLSEDFKGSKISLSSAYTSGMAKAKRFSYMEIIMLLAFNNKLSKNYDIVPVASIRSYAISNNI